MSDKIRKFTDLQTWKEGHKLVLMIYKETKVFPQEERYSLVDQMRRAAVSITSNIAEGFGRQGIKEKIQFYYIAKGSLIELENQILVARDVGHITKTDSDNILKQSDITGRLLQGLITKMKSLL